MLVWKPIKHYNRKMKYSIKVVTVRPICATAEQGQSWKLTREATIGLKFFWASAYKGGWPVLPFTASSSQGQCTLYPNIVAKVARGTEGAKFLKQISALVGIRTPTSWLTVEHFNHCTIVHDLKPRTSLHGQHYHAIENVFMNIDQAQVLQSLCPTGSIPNTLWS